MKKLRFILLGVKLLISLLSFIFRGESFKISLAASILLHFTKAIKSDVNFSTTPKQQKVIIPKFAKMSRFINDALESGSVSQEELSKIVQNNNREMRGSVGGEIACLFSNIKSIASQLSHFNEFLEDAEKSWRVNDSRNIKSNNNLGMSRDDILRATKDSGGYFFLALTYLLNPKNLSEKIKKAIFSSGAWFQFLDDYRDRKEDFGHKNTLFTVPQSNSHKELLKGYVKEPRAEIQKTIGEHHPLIKFMENLTTLVLSLDFTKCILDWK